MAGCLPSTGPPCCDAAKRVRLRHHGIQLRACYSPACDLQGAPSRCPRLRADGARHASCLPACTRRSGTRPSICRAVEVAFFRNLFGLVVVAPLLVRYGLSLFHTKQARPARAARRLNVVSMLAFFVGLSMTPLARATALTFTAPLFTALFSALFLGEVFRWRRWTAIFAGFFGALVILRPGLQVVRHRRAAGARLLAAVEHGDDRHQGAGPHRVDAAPSRSTSRCC